MPYSVKILADSRAPSGARLTTFELEYPRFAHADFLTHRLISRNASGSRATPVEKTIEQVLNDPALPVYWGKNQSGMQAREELDDTIRIWEQGHPCDPGETERAAAKRLWLTARDQAVYYVRWLMELGLHKQLANRILEPWAFITVIASATEWDNFFHLRCHRDAQPELQHIALWMKRLYDENEPKALNEGEWHMPLIYDEDHTLAWDLAVAQDEEEHGDVRIQRCERRQRGILKKVSVGRCARVSYLTHDGKRDLVKDIELHDRLLNDKDPTEPMHASPFEHVAMASVANTWSGNFLGFEQYRKLVARERVGRAPGSGANFSSSTPAIIGTTLAR